MTGNTVLLGIGLSGARHDVLNPLIALIFYAIGVSIGSFLTRGVNPDAIWDKAVSRVLFLEALLLIVSGAAWMHLRPAPNPLTTSAMLGCIATAIGLQSGSMVSLKLPGIVTTYITGTWTLLVSGLVQTEARRARLGEDEASFEERQMIQIVFLATYLLSAVTAGCTFRYLPAMMGVITVIPILLAATYGALRS
jgi:uncharacterized membrane protein YoaK (UPF0700 family)